MLLMGLMPTASPTTKLLHTKEMLFEQELLGRNALELLEYFGCLAYL